MSPSERSTMSKHRSRLAARFSQYLAGNCKAKRPSSSGDIKARASRTTSAKVSLRWCVRCRHTERLADVDLDSLHIRQWPLKVPRTFPASKFEVTIFLEFYVGCVAICGGADLSADMVPNVHSVGNISCVLFLHSSGQIALLAEVLVDVKVFHKSLSIEDAREILRVVDGVDTIAMDL